MSTSLLVDSVTGAILSPVLSPAFAAANSFMLGSNNLSDVANAATARNNLGLGSMAIQANPVTNLGDMIFRGSAGDLAKLAGFTSNSTAVLTQTGTGTISAAPIWATPNTILSIPRMGLDANDAALNAATGAYTGQLGVTYDVGVEKFWNGTYWVYPSANPSTSRFTPLFYTTKKVNGGVGPVVVLITGDSLTANKIIEYQTALWSQFGFAGYGIGRMSGVGSSGATFVGGSNFNYWPDGTFGTVPAGGIITYDDNTIAPILGNTIVFPYIKESGAGTFKLQTQSDSGAWTDLAGFTNVSAANATTIGAVITATVTRDYLRVRIVGLTGTVHVPSTPAIYDSTSSGALMCATCYPGISLTQLTTTPTAITTPIFAALPPVLVFYCNTDDAASQTTYLPTLYSNYQTGSGANDWVFVGINPLQSPNDPAAVSQNTIISAFALANNQSYFDDYSHFLSWTAANTAGLMTDGTHPNQQGRELSVGMMFQQMGFQSMLNKEALSINPAATSPRVLPQGGGSVSGLLQWRNKSVLTSTCDTTFQGYMRKEGVFTWAVQDSKSLSFIWGFQVANSSASPANNIGLFGTNGTRLVTIDPAQGNTTIAGNLTVTGGMAASNLTGTIPTARLGSGTANSTSVLFGDQTWKAGNAASGPALLDGNALLPAFTSPTIVGAGTITTAGTTAVVGSGTAFLTSCKEGSVIQSSGGVIQGTVVTITDDTHLTLSAGSTAAGVAYNIFPPTAQFKTSAFGNYTMVDGYGELFQKALNGTNFQTWIAPSGVIWKLLPDASGNLYVTSSSSNGSPFQIDAAAPSGAFHVLSTGTTLAGACIAGSFPSPAMTGTPTAPTAAAATNTTQVATTAFVLANAALSLGSANLTGQTAAVASVVAFTPSAAGTFQLSVYLNVTAILTDVIEVQATYTDQNSVAQTATFFPQGLTSALISTTGAVNYPPMIIRSKSGTAITIKTTLTTGGGTITYDVGGNIQKLN